MGSAEIDLNELYAQGAEVRRQENLVEFPGQDSFISQGHYLTATTYHAVEDFAARLLQNRQGFAELITQNSDVRDVYTSAVGELATHVVEEFRADATSALGYDAACRLAKIAPPSVELGTAGLQGVVQDAFDAISSGVSGAQRDRAMAKIRAYAVETAANAQLIGMSPEAAGVAYELFKGQELPSLMRYE